MAYGLVSAASIAASVLFILSLGGLSGQESAKRAIWYGIVGMAAGGAVHHVRARRRALLALDPDDGRGRRHRHGAWRAGSR